MRYDIMVLSGGFDWKLGGGKIQSSSELVEY